ncbi:MAG: nuclear transport factor 2 family protein [Candidatus Tumulicola sp.]
MRLKIGAAFACAAIAATGIGRAADVDDATQKALNANYALRCTAAFDPSDANLDAAFAVLAPDFVAIDPSGKQVTRDQVVGQGKQQMKMLHATACDDKVESYTLSDPNTIVAVADFHLEGDIQAPDGKHELVVTEKSQDTWKNVGGKWLAANSKDLQVQVKVDGNVVQDQGG